MDFNTALDQFCNAINEATKKHSEDFNNLDWQDDGTGYFKPVTFTLGKKRAKIIQNNGQTMVYCFVDLATGDILKPASWNVPAKGARGNIFDPSTYDTPELHGTGWMYKRR